MNLELAGAVYDKLLSGWRDARLVSGNRRIRCPFHDDRNPSLDIHEEKLVWTCRAGCGGGGAWDLAVRVLGEDEAHGLLEQLKANGTERVVHTRHRSANGNGSHVECRVDPPNHELEVLSDPTSEQIGALTKSSRLRGGATLNRLGAKLVRARFRKDDASSWGPWWEWIGFPTVSRDSWKLWALNRNGVARLDRGKLIRRNVGPVSLILSPELRDAAAGSVPVVQDVEGESDFLAAIEAGLSYVLTTTGGATSLGAHEANAEWLRALGIAEATVWGDRDEAGQRGAQKRAEWWLELGVSVRVPALPESLGQGGDLRDYLNGRAGVAPLGDAAALSALASAAQLRKPEPRQLEVEESEDRDGDELDNTEGHSALELPSIALRGSFRAFHDHLRPITGASPAHVFASWWAVLGVCIGRARWGTWSGRVVPLVYTLACGGTGDHKSTAMDTAISLLPEGVRPLSGCTSDAGLFDAFEASEGRPVLLHFDELGFLLRMAALSGSTLNPMLNRLWNAPPYLDRNLSKRNKDGGARRLDKPFACILGGIQPESFWLSIGDDRLAIASGFVNRFAVFASNAATSLPRTAPPDERAAEELRRYLVSLTRLPDTCVSLAPDAESLWDDFAQDHDARLRDMAMLSASVTKRVRDHVARLALVYATDDGRSQVSTSDLTAAIEVGAYLERSYRRLLEGRQADRGPARTSDLESIARRLLVKRPGAWQSARDLILGWPNTSRPSSRELRSVLQAMDGVEIQPAGGHGKERYRLARRGGGIQHTTPNSLISKGPSVVCCIGGPPLAE
jgi:hypothetical protein